MVCGMLSPLTNVGRPNTGKGSLSFCAQDAKVSAKSKKKKLFFNSRQGRICVLHGVVNPVADIDD